MKRRAAVIGFLGFLLAAGGSIGAGIHGDVSTLRGKIFYDGTAEGPVKIEVFDRPQFSPRPLYSVVISTPGLYEATVRSGTYYLRAYIDVNRNGEWDEGEPVGFYRRERGVVVLPLASRGGIDIRIEDGEKGFGKGKESPSERSER